MNIKLSLTIAASCLLAVSAFAQDTGLKPTTLNGGTNNIAADGTGTEVVQNVSNVDSVGFALSFKGVAAEDGYVQANVYRALVAGEYETTPSTVLHLGPLNGTTVVRYIADISVPNAVAIKIVPVNTNNVAITNVTGYFRLKAPKRATYPSPSR